MMVQWQTKEIYSQRANEGMYPIPGVGAESLVTPLACRLAATWTGLTGMVRLLAAYNLTDPT